VISVFGHGYPHHLALQPNPTKPKPVLFLIAVSSALVTAPKRRVEPYAIGARSVTAGGSKIRLTRRLPHRGWTSAPAAQPIALPPSFILACKTDPFFNGGDEVAI